MFKTPKNADFKTLCEMRESNPRPMLGKHQFCH